MARAVAQDVENEVAKSQYLRDRLVDNSSLCRLLLGQYCVLSSRSALMRFVRRCFSTPPMCVLTVSSQRDPGFAEQANQQPGLALAHQSVFISAPQSKQSIGGVTAFDLAISRCVLIAIVSITSALKRFSEVATASKKPVALKSVSESQSSLSRSVAQRSLAQRSLNRSVASRAIGSALGSALVLHDCLPNDEARARSSACEASCAA